MRNIQEKIYVIVCFQCPNIVDSAVFTDVILKVRLIVYYSKRLAGGVVVATIVAVFEE